MGPYVTSFERTEGTALRDPYRIVVAAVVVVDAVVAVVVPTA